MTESSLEQPRTAALPPARELSTTVRGRWLGCARLEAEPLWIWGLGIVLTVAGGLWLPVPQSHDRWALYIVLGTVFPGAVVAFKLVRSGRLAPWGAHGQALLALALLGLVVVETIRRADALVLVMASLEIPLILWLVGGSAKVWLREAQLSAIAARLLLWLVVGLGAWLVTTSLIWWTPGQAWLAGGVYSTGILILVTYLVLSTLWRTSPPARLIPGVRHLANLAALALFAFCSLRQTLLFSDIAFHSWSFIVGPAELVREGGWLLWDVPSQYGFLSLLALARLPTRTPWEALYILNAVLNTLAAAAIFLALRSLRRGVLSYCFSLTTALAAVFLRNHVGPTLTGPDVYPSTGAYRFFWCLLLLAILFLMVKTPSSGRWHPWLQVAGSLAWVVGVLWSAESAIYCTATWLPAYALMAAGGPARGPDGSLDLKRLLALLGLPLLAAGTAAGAIAAWYLVALGHAPDPVAFIEYGLAYQSGFGSWPLDPAGAGWVLLGVLVCLVALGATMVGEPGNPVRLAAVAGTGGAVWATSSYFVGRSHPNNVWNLAPVLCMAIALMLSLAGRGADMRWGNLARLSLGPLLIVMVAGPFVDLGGMAVFLTSAPQNVTEVEARLPPVDPSLEDLMLLAKVGPKDPVVYIGSEITLLPQSSGGRRQAARRPLWLPAAPYGELTILPPDRRQAHLERFLSRCREDGWLVEAVSPGVSTAWIHEQLARHFSETASFGNHSWRLTRYHPLDGRSGRCG